jgi:hypothetical protein
VDVANIKKSAGESLKAEIKFLKEKNILIMHYYFFIIE